MLTTGSAHVSLTTLSHARYVTTFGHFWSRQYLDKHQAVKAKTAHLGVNREIQTKMDNITSSQEKPTLKNGSLSVKIECDIFDRIVSTQ